MHTRVDYLNGKYLGDLGNAGDPSSSKPHLSLAVTMLCTCHEICLASMNSCHDPECFGTTANELRARRRPERAPVG